MIKQGVGAILREIKSPKAAGPVKMLVFSQNFVKWCCNDIYTES